MGFFSNLKHSLTGGWAEVSMITGEARRGEPLDVAVNVSVNDADISVDEIYVKLECREVVEIDNYRIAIHDGDDERDYIDVVECEDLFGRRFTLAAGQDLPANSRHAFEGTVEIPPHLPASYSGRNTRIEWRLYAGLEMRGNDPDSGWQRVTVA